MSQQMEPVFSIITVTYNASAVVEGTIRSVLSQKYHNIEYIIIDGASKDSTMDIIGKYRGRITTVISEKDRGIYDAMNKGIKAATGDYLCFLNAGDKFHSHDTLRRVAASLNRLGSLPGVVYGETEIVDGQGHDLGPRRLKAPEKLSWKSFRNGMVVCHQAFFARRDLALTEPYDLRYPYCADIDWCIRIMKRSKVLHNTGYILIDYLNEGMSTRNRWASLKERFAIMKHYYGLPVTLFRHAWFVLRSAFK